MAQASLQSRIPLKFKKIVEVQSAGIQAVSGLPSTVEAELASKLKGYDLSQHRSKLASEIELEKADLILCLEKNIAEILQNKYSMLAHRIYPLTTFLNESFSDLKDPYGSDISVYRDTLNQIDAILDKIEKKLWRFVQKELKARAKSFTSENS